LANTVSATTATDAGSQGILYEFCRNTTDTTAGCTSSTRTGVTTFTFTNLTDNQVYYYFVRAKDAVDNTSSWSASVNSEQDETPPTTAVIPNGSACETGSTTITLTCSDTSGVGCATTGTQYKVIDGT